MGSPKKSSESDEDELLNYGMNKELIYLPQDSEYEYTQRHVGLQIQVKASIVMKSLIL